MVVLICVAVDLIFVRTDPISALVDLISVLSFHTDPI